jgi:glyoxylase-like metal-dependent hydrolase (beta-lactamase superfamily II)
MHRLTLGNLELTAVSDGNYHLDGGAFFGVVPKVLWERKVKADENNQVPVGLNSVVVRTGRHTVLIETGMGNKLSERMQKIYGQPAKLLDNLGAAGISPEDIEVVINSHLHFDHCGWNTLRNQNGKIVPTFPRAKYYAPEGEWRYARHPSERDAISYIPDNFDPLVQSGQMTLLKGGEEIVPGISTKTFPGHTAHMQAVMIRGLGKGTASALPPGASEERALVPAGTRHEQAPTSACYISDLIPTTAHIAITWGMAFDLYPLQTIESKKQYYAQSVPEKWITLFTHDPNLPWAYVEEDAGGTMVARGLVGMGNPEPCGNTGSRAAK